MYQSQASPSPERNEIGFLELLSYKQVKCMKCLFWTGGPFTRSMSGYIYMPYPALKPPPHTHTHTQWWYEPETISIRSSCSSILPNPFISCLSSQILLFSLASYTYTARQPHFFYTIFPPPSAALIIYGACNEPAVDFSYYWLLQLKLLFPTEAGKMLLPSPPLLRHDSKILHNSVLVITHPSKFPQALSVNYGITATPSPLLPIQL